MPSGASAEKPLRRHAPDHAVTAHLLDHVGHAREFRFGEGLRVELDAEVGEGADQRVAEHLVGDGVAGDLLGRHHVLAHVLHDLVLELVVGDAHDLQVEVDVGRGGVDEAAHGVAQHHVLGGEGAELAAVEAQVARALEHDLAQADAGQGVEQHGLEAGQLGVEVGVLVARQEEPPHHRAVLLVEGGAAAVHGPADHLDAEPAARLQVEGAVDVVEPADVEVGGPHTLVVQMGPRRWPPRHPGRASVRRS